LLQVTNNNTSNMAIHHSPTAIEIPENHPILGIEAMLPLALHHPRSQFDEINFLNLLRKSCVLCLEEKLEILGAISRMNQRQMDGLIGLLVSEHEKLEFIVDEYPEDVADLVAKRMNEIALATVNRSIMNN
jgi:hypothetical protein